MNLPQSEEFIDIHTHGSIPGEGIFTVENLMAHQEPDPENVIAKAFTAGIHPWYLNESNRARLIGYIKAR
jgi:hypothetical protein